jgi:hypothetical protein
MNSALRQGTQKGLIRPKRSEKANYGEVKVVDLDCFSSAGSVATIRAARFFFVQHTKTGKYVPNDHKLYQMVIT